MRALTKTVLYLRYMEGNKLISHPIGIYANEDKCRPPAVAIVTAHRAGDVGALKAMGLDVLVAEDGKVKPVKPFARLTLPYEPDFAGTDADVFGEVSSATS